MAKKRRSSYSFVGKEVQSSEFRVDKDLYIERTKAKVSKISKLVGIEDGLVKGLPIPTITTTLADDTSVISQADFGKLMVITPTASRAKTTDTATRILSALSEQVTHTYDHIDFPIINTSSTASHTLTITGGTGVTTVGNMVVNGSSSGYFRLQVSNFSTPTFDLYRLASHAEGGIAVDSIVAGDGIDVSGATGDVTVTAETATDSNPGIVELATTAEADTGTDTAKAVTPAGLKSHVDARYSYQYISFTGNATTPADGDWMVPSGNGISNHLWNVNASNGSGGSSNGKTKDSSNITVTANSAGNGIVVPQACVLVGFQAFVRNSSRHANLGVDGDATEYLKDQRSCGLFVGQPDFNDYAATGDLTLRCYGAQLGQGTTGGGGDPDTDFYLRVTKATDMGNNISLSAGDMIVPAIAGTKSDGNHHSGGCITSWTIVLKTLIP